MPYEAVLEPSADSDDRLGGFDHGSRLIDFVGNVKPVVCIADNRWPRLMATIDADERC